MAFNGSEGEEINLQEAQNLTSNYKKKSPSGSFSTFIGKDLIHKILSQEGCMGIRMYYGQEDDGQPSIVLVGANVDENDMTEGVMADRGTACPPKCDYTSPLK